MTECNILFTSAGRRVSLVRLFRQALQAASISGKLVVADLKPTAPARFVADEFERVPPVTDPSYLDRLGEVCQRHRISLVIPLIDTELHLLAPHREAFARLGTRLLVSSPEVTRICFDKGRTFSFFRDHGFRTPALLDPDDIRRGRHPFPVLLKPVSGSASIGVTPIRDVDELEFYLRHVPEAIVQEYISGKEHTIDVLADFDGRVRSVVPRLRLETRAGEVSKGRTVKHAGIIAAATRVVEALPGPVGAITLQGFLTPDEEIVFIEINPRFGGGFPLSAAAGADFPRWLVEWAVGRDPEIDPTGWQDGLFMLRYDDAVFIPADRIG